MAKSNEFYAGIGSRETPYQTQKLMFDAAVYLGGKGFCLRSGGAEGADSAFEKGALSVSSGMNIFLPWDGFSGRRHDGCRYFDWSKSSNHNESLVIAESFHPNWQALSRGGRAMMARNCAQVLGHDLQTQCSFVLCWTAGGRGSGGTGQAIRIARSRGIQVFDLGIPEIDARVREKVYAQ